MKDLIDSDGMKPALYQEAMQDHLKDEPGLALPEPRTVFCPNCPYSVCVMPNLSQNHSVLCVHCGYRAPLSAFRVFPS